jgi:hypothetical protein
MGVKIIPGEEKSKVQIERELVEKHEQEVQEQTEAVEQEVAETPTEPTENIEETQDNPQPETPQVDEGAFFTFAKEKLGRDVNSWDDFNQVETKEVELPEDVRAFYEYKQNTGRSLKDFIELNKDYDNMSDQDIVQQYYKSTAQGLDDDDIKFEYDRKFGFDNDLDDDDDIRLKKIALKKEAVKAKEYFNQQKEQFNVPLESSTNSKSTQEAQREELLKRSQYFMDKTNEVLNDKFEGFKFSVGDKEVKYNPGDVSKIKEANSSIQNFASKHLNEDGYIKDPEAYHKALTIASDPDAFFKYAYELGQADAVNDVVKTGKNVDMQINKAPQEAKPGTKGARIIGAEAGRKQTIINYRK